MMIFGGHSFLDQKSKDEPRENYFAAAFKEQKAKRGNEWKGKNKDKRCKINLFLKAKHTHTPVEATNAHTHTFSLSLSLETQW